MKTRERERERELPVGRKNPACRLSRHAPPPCRVCENCCAARCCDGNRGSSASGFVYLPAGRPSIPSGAGLAKTVLIIIFLPEERAPTSSLCTSCRVGYDVIELFVVGTPEGLLLSLGRSLLWATCVREPLPRTPLVSLPIVVPCGAIRDPSVQPRCPISAAAFCRRQAGGDLQPI